MEVKLIFAWYDLWIGFYWHNEHCKLYFFPIPMFGIMIHFHKYCDKRFVKQMRKGNDQLRSELNQNK